MFEALRYERVKGAQKTGETTRDTWHKADFDEVKKNPKSMELQREEWILNFDAEEHAENNYAQTAALLKTHGEDGVLHLPVIAKVSAAA